MLSTTSKMNKNFMMKKVKATSVTNAIDNYTAEML
jgi:hypothetical protein